MASNVRNGEPHIIEIEDDVIDLDVAETSPEEVIYEWDAKIRKKLSMFAVVDNENTLWDLMKEYIQSLREVARSYEDNETLRNKVFCHISFLYSYYVELQCCYTPDNYLNNMEDILTLYCNLELEVIRPFKKKDCSKHIYKKRIMSVSRRIIQVLLVYLLERHDRILHVLIKMNTSNATEACAEVLKVLYQHFLIKVPALNLSDESFCRYYIVFQKWKEIRKIEEWEGMDKVMYKMFKRTPDSIKNNESLRQILMPACNSTVDIFMNIFRSFRDISNAYFKHISAKKKITELDDFDFNIDLGEDEPTISVDDDDEEEVSFLKAYYEVERNMSNLPNNTDSTDVYIARKFKEEVDEDDDVQFVGISILSKQPTIDVVIDYSDNEETMSNINEKHQEERIAVSTPPVVLCPTREKNSNLENMNGITVGSFKSVAEISGSCHSAEVQTTEDQPFTSSSICSIKEVISACDVSTETDQPEVPLLSTNTQISIPSSPAKIASNSTRDTPVNTRTVTMKSVEVQADNYIYNDYGLTTPPFDVTTEEQTPRPIEPRLYTDIGQNRKDNLISEERNVVQTRSIEIQVDPPSSSKDCPYNDYGLTPPNDTHLDDHNTRVQETCLYTNIGHKDLSERDHQEIITHNNSVDNVAQENNETETEDHENDAVIPNVKNIEYESTEEIISENLHDSEEDEFEDISDAAHIDAEYEAEKHDTDKENSPLRQNETSDHPEVTEPDEELRYEIRINPELQVTTHEMTDQIDTGQKVILNTAPNIEPETETKDLPLTEPYNGNTILKPLVSSNRTNGQAKDVNNTTPTKIMYTSSQKIKSISLEDFSKFESAIHNNQWKENNEFDEIMSGPVSKTMPTNNSTLLTSQDKLNIFGTQESSKPVTNINSRSNSPNDMTSPAFEDIEDFRNYYNSSVNGRVPPSNDVKVPPGILKKSNSAKRKNYRIMFHESTCDHFEERRPRSDGVLVSKRVRRDRKLNMEARVVLERLSFIENKMKKVLNNPPTLRVDYDKTTTHINEKDVVRCISPPRFSWILNIGHTRPNTGSLTVKNREHLEKKPKKRKLETQSSNSIEEPAMRKRAFRTPKKKSLATNAEGKGVRGRKKSGVSENTYVSKSDDSEFDKLLNSGAYSNKPFRLDLTS